MKIVAVIKDVCGLTTYLNQKKIKDTHFNMASYKKNKKKMEEAIIKLQQIKTQQNAQTNTGHTSVSRT